MIIKKYLLLFLLIAISSLSFAQERFVRELTYETKSDIPTEEVREKAVNEIKRILMEELGSYVVNQATYEVHEDNEAIDEDYRSKTQNFSLSLMKTRILEEKRRNKSFYIKVAIDIDDTKLNKDLQEAGFSANDNVLAKVFEMLQANNAPSVSTQIIATVNGLLNGLSVMESKESGNRIFNVSKNGQYQILDGENTLSGKYQIIYSGGSYVVFYLNVGYLDGMYEHFDSDNVLIETGTYSQSKRQGIWESYSNQQGDSYLYQTTEFDNGMKNGKMSILNRDKTPELIRYYEDDIPVAEEMYDSHGSEVYKGPLDKYGKKEGKWVYFKNDKILSFAHFKNGLKHGESVSYYNNGQISAEGKYVNDNNVGLFKSYYINGQLEEQKEYDADGNRTGDTYQYYPNGKYQATYIYNQKEGSKRISKFYENGNIQCEENYLIVGSNRIKQGKHLAYFEDGTLEKEENYENNLLSGDYNLFFEDGSVRMQMHYEIIDGKSVKDKALIEYNRSKQLWKSENYNKGVFDGIQTYYSQGNKSEEDEYNNGVKLTEKHFYSGGQLKEHKVYPPGGKPSIEKTYYENGHLKSEEFHLAPEREGATYSKNTGEHKYYSSAGIILRSYNYKDNKKDGLAISYDSAGKPKCIEVYVNGQREGYYATFYQGELREFGTYKADDRSGAWYKFSMGDNVEEKTYIDGRSVETKTYVDAQLKNKLLKSIGK
jgi:antitoxin component YwqK of YwqJK toxin-antitoxin module